MSLFTCIFYLWHHIDQETMFFIVVMCIAPNVDNALGLIWYIASWLYFLVLPGVIVG